MDNTYESVARRASVRLAGSLDPNLPALTERALAEDGAPRGATRSTYDPATAVALAALLLNVAKFGWDIYRDLRSEREKAQEKTEKEDPRQIRQVLVRRIRLKAGEPRGLSAAQRDLIVEAVAEEILLSEDAGRS
jgi:hypothetical protein